MKKTKLIHLYCTVCQCYDTILIEKVQRLSNNFKPAFKDEEILTIYLFWVMQKNFEIKSIYNHTKEYLSEWFPLLPSYKTFNKRLCNLAPAFASLCEYLIDSAPFDDLQTDTFLLDSLPIILSKGSNCGKAKVARELCAKTYSATKKVWYFGMKLHFVGQRRVGKIPKAKMFCVTSANTHDLPIGIAQIKNANISNATVIGDKAYCDKAWEQELAKANVKLLTPRKKVKGQIDVFKGGDAFSTFVSKMRQPVESFFHWLDEKTHIQVASKVRSTKGLIVHIFGKIASALMFLNLDFNC